jgi:hypothetical protein
MQLECDAIASDCRALEKRILESISEKDNEGIVLLVLLKLLIRTIEAHAYTDEVREFILKSIKNSRINIISKDYKLGHNPVDL